jgi:hypothetical protein
MTKLRQRLPMLLAGIYALFFTAVLVKNVIWSVGDQTDVIRVGLAAFPLGLITSFVYPGGREGAFVAVGVCGALNTWVIYLLSRWFMGKRQK